jgi:hypothetical protein
MSCKIKILMLFILMSFKPVEDKNKLGELKAGKFIITANIEKLKSDWNNILKENHLNGKLSKFEIKKDFDKYGKIKDYFYLISISTDTKIKMATLIQKSKNSFYLPNSEEQQLVVCYGCEDCHPKRYKDNWVCDTKNIYDCKKIVIVTNIKNDVFNSLYPTKF